MPSEPKVLDNPYGWMVSESDPAECLCGACHGECVLVDEEGGRLCGWCAGRGIVSKVELDAIEDNEREWAAIFAMAEAA